MVHVELDTAVEQLSSLGRSGLDKHHAITIILGSTLGGTKLFGILTRRTVYARFRQHINILVLSRLWRAKRDVGFVIGFVVRNGFR